MHVIQVNNLQSGSQELAEFAPLISLDPHKFSVHLLKGIAKICPNKKPNGERDFVTILVGLIRLQPPFSTDILVTLNIPDKHTNEDTYKCQLGESQEYKAFVAECERDFQGMVQSFTITGEQSVKDLLGM